MIILEPYGGLANRMRAVASALSLAREYKKKLLVLWPMNESLNFGFYKLFVPIEGVNIICCTPLFYRIFRIIAGAVCKWSFPSAQSSNVGQIIETIKNSGSVYISSCYQFYSLDGYKCFTPVDAILDRVSSILPENCTNLVGVHIRRTDNIESITMSPTELFEHAIEEEIENNPRVQFYLATDSPEEEQRLISVFGPRIIVNTCKDLRRDSQQGIVDALVDLICLSRTTKIFGSFWSSFSETAAIMGSEKELVIIKNEKKA